MNFQISKPVAVHAELQNLSDLASILKNEIHIEKQKNLHLSSELSSVITKNRNLEKHLSVLMTKNNIKPLNLILPQKDPLPPVKKQKTKAKIRQNRQSTNTINTINKNTNFSQNN